MNEKIGNIGFAISMLVSAATFGFLWFFEWRGRGDSWHRWFAYHPVKIEGRTVWLETVERRFCDMAGGGGYYWWEYREIA